MIIVIHAEQSAYESIEQQPERMHSKLLLLHWKLTPVAVTMMLILCRLFCIGHFLYALHFLSASLCPHNILSSLSLSFYLCICFWASFINILHIYLFSIIIIIKVFYSCHNFTRHTLNIVGRIKRIHFIHGIHRIRKPSRVY